MFLLVCFLQNYLPQLSLLFIYTFLLMFSFSLSTVCRHADLSASETFPSRNSWSSLSPFPKNHQLAVRPTARRQRLTSLLTYVAGYFQWRSRLVFSTSLHLTSLHFSLLSGRLQLNGARHERMTQFVSSRPLPCSLLFCLF